MTLSSEELEQMEQAARQFQGAWTGTSGSLAAMLLRAVQEIRRLRVEAARREESSVPYWMERHD